MERCAAREQLVGEAPKRPEVHFRPVAVAPQHIGSHVVVGAAERVELRHPFVALVSLVHVHGEAKVGEAHVAAAAQQHVLRLEVPVHDAPLVAVLQSQQHLRGVEARGGLGEAASLPEVRVQVSVHGQLGHQVQVRGGLEGLELRQDEGVRVDAVEDPALLGHLRRLALEDHLRLAHAFQSAELRGHALRAEVHARQVHTSECAVPDQAQQLHSLQRQRQAPLARAHTLHSRHPRRPTLTPRALRAFRALRRRRGAARRTVHCWHAFA
mmetsp:Transcript_11638/g.43384  ORF Transcript_11638/g.43384 Transcript_11638/m.43384 type:complete len:268 (+) Transcript_11638:1072-1875(+)